MEKEKSCYGCCIRIKVAPKSSRDQVVGHEQGVYKVKVTAPPSEGKANKAVISLLSKVLGVAKGNVKIISGRNSKIKTLRIRGVSAEEIKKSLPGVMVLS